VTTTDAICNCGENAERQGRRFSQRVQWTPLLLVISIFACENTQCGPRLNDELLLILVNLEKSCHCNVDTHCHTVKRR